MNGVAVEGNVRLCGRTHEIRTRSGDNKTDLL